MVMEDGAPDTAQDGVSRPTEFMVLAYGPTGTIAGSYGSGAIRLCDTDFKCVAEQQTPPDRMAGSIAFSPDGRTLAVGRSARCGQGQRPGEGARSPGRAAEGLTHLPGESHTCRREAALWRTR